MAIVTMKALLETGVHFGHRTRKWDPRMKPYIFTERNGIHIIDLQQTLEALETAYALVRDTVAQGSMVLFVGTKRQAQDTIEAEATRCGMPYVNLRWLGGTLTNWVTISRRVRELDSLEKKRDAGEFQQLTKKEELLIQRKIERLIERLGGIRVMRELPKLIFVVDVRREETAVHEANLLGIPVIALVDTNCDPRPVDYIIPSNDDAIRAIKLLAGKIADAVLEGKALRKEEETPEAEAEEAEALVELEMADEDLLGEATLAKLQSGAFGEEEQGWTEGLEGLEEPEEPEHKPASELKLASEESQSESGEDSSQPSTKKRGGQEGEDAPPAEVGGEVEADEHLG